MISRIAATLGAIITTAAIGLGVPLAAQASAQAPGGVRPPAAEAPTPAPSGGLAPGQFSPAPGAEAFITHRGPIGQEGRWYTDGDGRAIITSGVNMVYKHPPYTAEAAGFDAHDADWLRDNGFDSVRLGIMWKAVEPQPGLYDDAYLANVRDTVRLLTERGIMVLLDAHQDMYNEKFQGEFAPEWAVIDDGLPSVPQLGFPTNQAVNIGLIRAYDNFLANAPAADGVGVRDRFVDMWGHVAAFFAGEPGIMGYDILNEPWPGSAYVPCYLHRDLPSCANARDKLDQLHSLAGAAIEANHPGAIVHYEPYSMWNMGFDTAPAAPSTTNHALSWHVYCATNAAVGTYWGCDIPDTVVFDNAERHAAAQGSATLLSEFGATDDPGTLNGVISKARDRLVGWQYWSYCGCNDPTTQNQREQGIVADPTVPGPVTPEAVNREKLAILAAPHLRATAGTPTSVTWHDGVFIAGWSPERVDGSGAFPAGAITEIAVPGVNFPRGYDVQVTGGTVLSPDSSPRLLIASDGTGAVQVTVTPRP